MDNPSHTDLTKAIALYYDGDNAPVISAKGMGEQAEEIIAIAQENNVPLCDNALLVELLSKMELGDSVPHHLYTSIAHILSFAYTLDSKMSSLKL